ncbi:hypothetical protein [Mesonia sp.]|uniref:hypothetical protein n=1 Tax=Mesonia sp. TaxID=1960830 RepID=UPI001751419C|nr:hypothetical protein [Mesonia sp.]HIB36859.1 hypothetical protein [Mesonia sp.]
MQTDIINTNYINNLKIIKVWKRIILAYGIWLIYLTSLNGIEKIYEYESIISSTSNIFIISGLIIILLNTIIYLRVGTFVLKRDVLILNQNKKVREIELDSIETIVFGKEYGKFYYLKVEQSDFIIELNESQLYDFKKIIGDLNIKIINRNFTDRLRERFGKKFELNKN